MPLTEEQKARIAENRQRAMEIRAARLSAAVAADTDVESPDPAPGQSRDVATTTGHKRPAPEDHCSISRLKLQARLQHDPFSAGGFAAEDNVIEGEALRQDTGTGNPAVQSIPRTEPRQGPPEPVGDHCDGCNVVLHSGNMAQSFADAFGVAVCAACHGDGDFELMTKSDAQKQFLLPDASMKVLRFMEKQNPRHTNWKPMKLYLRKQVRERSYRRWGGSEGLAAEREKREARQWEGALRRTAGIME